MRCYNTIYNKSMFRTNKCEIDGLDIIDMINIFTW